LPNATTIEGLEYIDTSNVTNMNAMFNGSSSLRELEFSSWDTSNVTDMGWMFQGTNGLSSLDLSSWDTGRVVSMNSMFRNTSGLVNLDASTWDTSNVTNMNSMFANATGLVELDLSNWDTRRVTDMTQIFMNVNSLRVLSLGENFVFRLIVFFPNVPNNATYTGRWQNIGAGTIENPTGSIAFTSAELVNQFNGATMADTFVWQRRDAIVP